MKCWDILIISLDVDIVENVARAVYKLQCMDVEELVIGAEREAGVVTTALEHVTFQPGNAALPMENTSYSSCS